MPPTVDWATKVITVPQSDLSFVSGTLYDLDTNQLRLDLKSIEDSEDGMPFERITTHATEVTVAGVTYARTIEIINGYSLFFEDTGSDYQIRFQGSNNNFFDQENGILVPTPHVSYIPGNSAGLIVTSTSGLTPTELQYIVDVWTRLFGGRLYVDPATGKEVIRDNLGNLFSEADVFSDDGITPYDGNLGIARRDDHVKP
jgi:hypothetical protein